MIPVWLHAVSIAYVSLGLVCASFIAQDLVRHPQNMWIMNIVWPVTALFGTLAVVWQYFAYGRLAERRLARRARQRGEEPLNRELTPFPVMVGNGALHCGSGCTLGDLFAEWLVFLIPTVAIASGWKSIFSDKIFAIWVVDYFFAYIFGIAFQYFTIAPMRGLSVVSGLVQAVKADTLSLTAWQVGMYGYMAFAHFIIFGAVYHARLRTESFEFWFMMQIAMIFGFMTSYPVNWWLIRRGVKEAM